MGVEGIGQRESLTLLLASKRGEQLAGTTDNVREGGGVVAGGSQAGKFLPARPA